MAEAGLRRPNSGNGFYEHEIACILLAPAATSSVAAIMPAGTEGAGRGKGIGLSGRLSRLSIAAQLLLEKIANIVERLVRSLQTPEVGGETCIMPAQMWR